MYHGLVESILVIALAGLGLTDAWRLSESVRAGGAFHDVVGPDRYLIVLSLGLVVCGVCNLIGSLKAIRCHDHKPPGEPAKKEGKLNLVVLVAVMLILYTAAFPLLGYLLATAIFFPVIYFIFGLRPWTKSVIVGILTAALFYVIFAYFSDMPLPKGLFENIL